MSVAVIPNAIPRSLCRAAEACWPSPSWNFWHRYNGKTSNKFASMDRCRIPAGCIAALDALAITLSGSIGESFIDYDLHGAGMHMMPPNGFLAWHVDAENHPLHRWVRTHSIVLFVNSRWELHYGGELEIETLDGVKHIRPQQGTAVIFNTDRTWHQVKPVTTRDPLCPNSYRKTLALFGWNYGQKEGGSTSAVFDGGMR